MYKIVGKAKRSRFSEDSRNDSQAIPAIWACEVNYSLCLKEEGRDSVQYQGNL